MRHPLAENPGVLCKRVDFPWPEALSQSDFGPVGLQENLSRWNEVPVPELFQSGINALPVLSVSLYLVNAAPVLDGPAIKVTGLHVKDLELG